jgi:hypothetical protein
MYHNTFVLFIRYFACNSENEVVREDRCPGKLRFQYDEQKCDYSENVQCDIDDRDIPQVCPTFQRGIFGEIKT